MPYEYEIPAINGKPLVEIPKELKDKVIDYTVLRDKIIIKASDLVDQLLYDTRVKVRDELGRIVRSITEYSYPPFADAVVTKDEDYVYAYKPANNFKGYILIDKGEAGVEDVKVIQKALDSLTSGGTLKISKGEFLINSKLTIPSDIIISGEGEKTILKRTFDGALIDQSSGSNIVFKDLTFHGGGKTKIFSIWRTGCENIYYENVKFINEGQTTNSWDWGLAFYGATNCCFKGYVIGFSEGLVITNGSRGCIINATVKDTKYIDTSFEAICVHANGNFVKARIENVGYRGLLIRGSDNIIDVEIIKTGDYGIWFEEGYNNIIRAVVKEAGINQPRSGGGIGIKQGRNNKIIAHIEKCWYDGMVLGAHITDIPDGTPAYVEANTIIISSKNNNQSGEQRVGIKLYTGTKKDAYIRYNTLILGEIVDDQDTPTQYIGIHITGSGIMEENVFKGGRIYGNTHSAMDIGGNNNIFEDISIDGAVNINAGIHKFIRCKGYTTKNSGTATFSGDGSTTDFLIGDHGLAVTDPNRIVVKVTPISQDAINASPCVGYVDPNDNTKIRVKFASAPASGTDNVKIAWTAEVI